MNDTKKPFLTIVVAVGENREIGRGNQLLWHLPADLKHFKEITSGHSIIMGRKTFESIGKALPNRRNIVISASRRDFPAGVVHASGFEEALQLCAGEEEAFIIGGGSIYETALPFTDAIELTTVHGTFEADVFFPEIPEDEWKTDWQERHEADEKNAFAYTFSRLSRR